MFNHRRLIVIIVITIALLSLITYVMISEGVFIEKGSELLILGKKTYIDPGNLLYSCNSDNGAWVVYRKTGQTIIAMMDKYGVRQWQKVYSASRLLVHSSNNYTIVGETRDHEIAILDTSGKVLRTWTAGGIPLLCNIADDGRSAVVSEINASSSDFNWSSTVSVRDAAGKLLFSNSHSNTEIIDIVWLADGVATLKYIVEESGVGQYLVIYDNGGNLLYQEKIDEAVGDISVSPTGTQLMWSTNTKVTRYDVTLDVLATVEINDIIGAGFLSDDTLYMLRNKSGILPPGRRVHLLETDLEGKRLNIRVYPGTLSDYKVLSDNSLVITTDIGVYAVTSMKGIWYVEMKSEIISSSLDSSGTVYVFTKDDSVSWFEKP